MKLNTVEIVKCVQDIVRRHNHLILFITYIFADIHLTTLRVFYLPTDAQV
jgi:hypothetical protein